MPHVIINEWIEKQLQTLLCFVLYAYYIPDDKKNTNSEIWSGQSDQTETYFQNYYLWMWFKKRDIWFFRVNLNAFESDILFLLPVRTKT